VGGGGNFMLGNDLVGGDSLRSLNNTFGPNSEFTALGGATSSATSSLSGLSSSSGQGYTGMVAASQQHQQQQQHHQTAPPTAAATHVQHGRHGWLQSGEDR